jgi:hypothetical protein
MRRIDAKVMAADTVSSRNIPAENSRESSGLEMQADLGRRPARLRRGAGAGARAPRIRCFRAVRSIMGKVVQFDAAGLLGRQAATVTGSGQTMALAIPTRPFAP